MANSIENLTDEHASMSQKVFLSRRLAKERIDCPGCGKNLSVASLAWSHKCKTASETAIQTKLTKMREQAVQTFQARNQAREGPGHMIPGSMVVP